MNKKYLYGAAVQGIQGFIFQTNKLQEIVGASALVDDICRGLFKETVGVSYVEYDDKKKFGAVLHAAGNIKYIFESREACEHVVREFPKKVSQYAPGITISQAVVKLTDDAFDKAVDELEGRLRVQRNKPMRSATLGLMGIARSRQTGLPVVDIIMEKHGSEMEEKHLDAGSKAKLAKVDNLSLCEKAFGKEYARYEYCTGNIEKIPSKNDWIAIIHADGNGLGQVVQKVGKDAAKFKDFSERLDKATCKAAQQAFLEVKEKYHLLEANADIIPIRPIVLGGDDLTVVCRGDLALDYATAYLDHFEKQTEAELGKILSDNGVFPNETEHKLTACAGIAYIKSSYPFYYGYDLAETLCGEAKKDAKNKEAIKQGDELPDSCLMFHKVQDSFVESWSAIVDRELKPQPDVSFAFGPYYLHNEALSKPEHKGKWSVAQLLANLVYVSPDDKDSNAVKSHLRKWMSLLHDNSGQANQYRSRVLSLLGENDRKFVDKVTFEYGESETLNTPAYDLLAVNTIINQNTKEA